MLLLLKTIKYVADGGYIVGPEILVNVDLAENIKPAVFKNHRHYLEKDKPELIGSYINFPIRDSKIDHRLAVAHTVEDIWTIYNHKIGNKANA